MSSRRSPRLPAKRADVSRLTRAPRRIAAFQHLRLINDPIAVTRADQQPTKGGYMPPQSQSRRSRHAALALANAGDGARPKRPVEATTRISVRPGTSTSPTRSRRTKPVWKARGRHVSTRQSTRPPDSVHLRERRVRGDGVHDRDRPVSARSSILRRTGPRSTPRSMRCRPLTRCAHWS